MQSLLCLNSLLIVLSTMDLRTFEVKDEGIKLCFALEDLMLQFNQVIYLSNTLTHVKLDLSRIRTFLGKCRQFLTELIRKLFNHHSLSQITYSYYMRFCYLSSWDTDYQET